MKKIAVVTGSNRGLGFETCRQLAKKNFQVILTSRDESKGKTAVDKLREEGLDIVYHPLDIINIESINEFKNFIYHNFSRLDVLVNNAGVNLDNRGDLGYGESIFNLTIEILHKTMETNVYGPLILCQTMIPLMIENKYGRIINVSSGMGQFSIMGSGYSAYRISKTAINVLTCILAAELKDKNILVNSVCPGWVKTDMGGSDAPQTVEEGVYTTIWLATLPDDGPTGKFFRNQEVIDW